MTLFNENTLFNILMICIITVLFTASILKLRQCQNLDGICLNFIKQR